MGAGERIKELASRAEAAVDSARASLGSSLASADIPDKLERLVRSSRELLGKISLPVGELHVEVAQDQGSREVQQDAVAFVELPGMPPRAVAVVADGIGGLECGEVASALAVAAFCDTVRKLGSVSADDLRQALFAANEAVFSKNRRMGTTLTACAIDNGSIRWISVGDSRAYLARAGNVSQLTVDHLQDGDRLTTGNWESAPLGKSGALASFLGADEIPLICEGELPTKLHAGDCILVCTDGVHGVIDLKGSLAKFTAPPEDLATTLLDEVLGLQVSSQDNATVLVLSVKGLSPVKILKNVPVSARTRGVSLPQLNGRILFGAAVVLLMIIIWWAAQNQNERFGIKKHPSPGSSTSSASSAANRNQPTEATPSASMPGTTVIPENGPALSPQAGDNPVSPPSIESISSSSSVSTAGSLDIVPQDPPSAAQAAGELSSSSLALVSSELPSFADATTSVAQIGESSSSLDADSASSVNSKGQVDLAVEVSDATASSFAANWSTMPSTDTALDSSSEISPGMFSSAPAFSSPSSSAPTTFAKDASVAKKRYPRLPGSTAPANSNQAVKNDNNPEPSINIHLNLQELFRNLPRFPIPSGHPREPLRR